jgi:hypothetical protein
VATKKSPHLPLLLVEVLSAGFKLSLEFSLALINIKAYSAMIVKNQYHHHICHWPSMMWLLFLLVVKPLLKFVG